MSASVNLDFDQFDTRDLWQKDLDHNVHPYSIWPIHNKVGCTVLVRGEGMYLYDSDGKQYLDTNAGLWCVNIGYGREEMADAIADQVRQLHQVNNFGTWTSVPAAELSDKVTSMAPDNLNHIFFSNGGSAANESAIRMAHHFFIRSGRADKKHIIARIDGYHGTTFLTSSITGKPILRHGPFQYIDELIHHISSPNVYRRPEGTTVDEFCDLLVEELENKIKELGPENVACFIAEPIMGVGGVLEPPQGYHRRTWEVCKKYDVLYIHDEVITGFGRLGHMFSSKDVFDVEPDIITCAKGITSGYMPLGGTLISDEIFEVMVSEGAIGPFSHGFTYSGHPACCAAALKNIEIFEREKICEHIRDIGPYFEEKIASLKDMPLVGDARGRSSIFCIEHVSNKETKELFPPEALVGLRVANKAQEMGLFVRGAGEIVLLSPPLIINREQIDTIVDTLRRCEEAVTDDLIKEGLWKG